MSTESARREPASPHAWPEVELPEGTLVVGDLHLDVFDAEACARFEDWLAGIRGAPALVVLGDLFEYWVGPAQLAGAERVVRALRGAVDSGTRIELVPGNRDFLLEQRFERATGVRLHPHGFVGLLPGGAGGSRRALVIHGDELCTLDRPYQRLRATLRSRPVRGMASRLPRPAALWVAERLRRASRKATRTKPRAEMAQQPDACRELARHADATILVCGHSHVFRDEPLEAGPRWLVVDAFGGTRDTLEVTADGDLRARPGRGSG